MVIATIATRGKNETRVRLLVRSFFLFAWYVYNFLSEVDVEDQSDYCSLFILFH